MTSAVIAPLLVALAMSAVSGTAPDPCANSARKPGASIEAYVIAPVVRVRDTVVNVAVCILPARSSRLKIGSYHGELYFDSTAASIAWVEKSPGGLRVENANVAGQVNFAGAAPTGFTTATFLKVMLRVKQPGAQPKLRLKMLELNATDGSNLMKQLVTSASRAP